MSALLLSFPSLADENSDLRKQYTWLLSDFDEMTWVVRDPYSEHNTRTETLNFHGVLAPSLDFKDCSKIVSDLKRSLVFAVELSRLSVNGFIKVSSLSKMRVYLNSLKRCYREVFAMHCKNISQLNSEDVVELKRRLALPEEVSMGYEKRLKVFFDVCQINSLPIKVYEERKNPSSIDMEWLCRELGLIYYVVVRSVACQRIIQSVNDRLSKIHSQHRWVMGKESKGSKSTSGQEHMLTDHLTVLNAYYRQSDLLDAFNYPLKNNPVERSIKADAEALSSKQESRERTRNIPADQFLMIMDRATRWVVDYAEPLFKLEAEARPVYQEYVDRHGEYVGGKHMNGYIREHSSAINIAAKSTPFPLSGYKTKLRAVSPTQRKYDSEFVGRLSSLREQGIDRKAICSELGLTINQYVGLTYNAKDPFGRTLQTTGISLNSALYEFLPLCCALILLAFTAGRESAVYSLKAGCVFKVLGSRYIRMYVPKTLRKDDDFPTVALVEKAVDVLARLSARAREINGDEKLFQFVDLVERATPKGFRFDNVALRI